MYEDYRSGYKILKEIIKVVCKKKKLKTKRIETTLQSRSELRRRLESKLIRRREGRKWKIKTATVVIREKEKGHDQLNWILLLREG